MHGHRYLLALTLVAACEAPDRVAAPTALSLDRVARPAVVVHPGGSIQAAIDAAQPGDVIAIEPGTYMEAVHVGLSGLKLVGRGGSGRVVIANPGGEDNGVTVDPGSDGFALVNVTVRGFAENGVFLNPSCLPGREFSSSVRIA